MEDLFCNDPIHYTHTLCTITYPYMQCSHPQCSDPVSQHNTLRVWSTSCSTRSTLEANSWITYCIVASCFCSPYIIYICIGVMHWVTSCIVKSRFLCSISFWGLTLLIAFKSATLFLGMYLIPKSYSCIVSYILIDWMVHLVKSDFSSD